MRTAKALSKLYVIYSKLEPNVRTTTIICPHCATAQAVYEDALHPKDWFECEACKKLTVVERGLGTFFLRVPTVLERVSNVAIMLDIENAWKNEIEN